MEERNGQSVGQGISPSRHGQGTHGTTDLKAPPDGQLKPNRADLILFFGLVSLLCCWPLGIAAWIMGNSDLKGIRNGSISSEGLGTLKAGRILGILGTVIFALSVSAAIVAAITFPAKVPGLRLSLKDKVQEWLKRSLDDFKSVPLPKEKLSFTGEWTGDRGTILRIYPNGRGDYRASSGPGRTSSLSGGRVRFDGEQLSVGLFGIQRTFHIDKPPSRQNGAWTMTLSGEVFTKKGSLESPPEPREFTPGRPREYEVRNRDRLIGVGSYRVSGALDERESVHSLHYTGMESLAGFVSSSHTTNREV